MSIFEDLVGGLMGKVNYTARSPAIDTGAGQRAIYGQANRGGQQALAQSYALANSGRAGGGSQALAMREAQRRGAEATANLQGQAVAQSQALQQAAMQQQAQGEMQAQQINAGIAQQEAGGMKQLVSAGLLAGALMSDYRQKEMISDFEDKESFGRFASVDDQIPEYQQGAMPDPSGMRPAPARANELPQQAAPVPAQQGPTLYERARARTDANPIPIAQYQSQLLRTVNERAAPQYQAPALQPPPDPNAQANAQALQFNREQAARLMKQAEEKKTSDGLMGISSLLSSDKRAKEKAYSEGVRAGSMRSPMVPGYGPPLQPAPSAPGYGQPRPMISDFQQKEDLDPVRPTLYRYNPESSERQAQEAAQRTYVNTLEDKRAPREGIVAQDLQHSPAFGPSVVEKDDGQLAIDRDRALSTALYELGEMHQRVKRLEGGRRGA